MTTFPLTGSQTVGPFFAPTLLREGARRNVLATAVGLEDALVLLVGSGDDERHRDHRDRHHDGAGERHDPPVELGTSRGAHASGHGLLAGAWSTLDLGGAPLRHRRASLEEWEPGVRYPLVPGLHESRW